jgi:type IV secretion system protein VirB10
MENNEIPDAENEEAEPAFELTPEQATAFDDNGGAPGRFNRKRVMIAISLAAAVVIGGGLLYNVLRPVKKNAGAETEAAPGDSPAAFLGALRDRAAARGDAPSEETTPAPDPQPELPQASFARPQERPPYYPPPQNAPQAGPPPPAQAPDLAPVYRSPLVPPVEGSLFSGAYRPQQQPAQQPARQTAQQPGSAEDFYRGALGALSSQNAAPGAPAGQVSDYAAQNDQAGKRDFYDSSYNGGGAAAGYFLGEDSIWTGTVIPGALETAVNTDLPGNVLARVTRNIYDSLTGRKLLIPQGTVLIAKYNSSVSYAQRRVQIVWDLLIRPDGFQLELGGMNAVDRAGMSGQEAVYHENWFEYLKAAGIVTMFSLASARMTETAAKYADDSSASAIASSSSGLVNQLGGSMASRAMNIQPTLTVENGTLINVMLNQTLRLPPVDAFPVVRR